MDGINLDHMAGEALCFNSRGTWTAKTNESTGIPFLKCRREKGVSKDSTCTVSVTDDDILVCAASLLFEREKRCMHLVGFVGFSPWLSSSVQSPVLCVDFQSPSSGLLAS